nr:uncharacterized mitochondrial protein AtMg00810-like [Tanacetum cinerariifolium]
MMGKISFFLGLQISQSPRGIFINQSKYALESLKKYGFESCDPVDTPMVEKSKLDEDREGKAVDPSHYRGSAYRKARPCSQKDLSIPLWNHSSGTMATMIEQQVALDEALIPSTKSCPFFKAFLVTADVSEIYMQEFWATAYVHQHSIRFKLDNKKHIINLETFRDMLHICPRIPDESFDELPFEEEILEFLWFLGHSAQIKTLTDVNINKLFQPWRSFGVVINKCLTGKSSGFDSFRLTAATKGKQLAKAKSPSDPLELARTEAQQLKILLRRSRQETHISQHGGSDEGTGSKPGVLDVPSDDSKEEISWNSSDDEETDTQEQDRHNDKGDEKDESDDSEEDDNDDKDGDESDDDNDDDEEEIAEIDVHDDTERGRDDDEASENEEESDDEETKEEESFDPIPKTPEDSKDDGNDEEDQGFKDGMESIFATASSSVAPLPTPTLTMTPSIITTITKSSHPPIPPTPIPNPFAKVVFNISGIVHQYMNQQMNEAVRVAVQIKTDRLFLTRSSHSSRTSYVIAADLSEMELKKILIEKMEGNKSIQRSDEQRNLYKALVEAYEADKIILDTYGEHRGSKRQREGKEPESARAPLEPATRSVGRSTTGSKSRQASTSESAFAEEPVQTTSQIEEPSHLVFETGAEDQPIVQTSQHPEWFSQPKKPPTLDHDWNKTLPAVQRSAQTWISKLAKQDDSRSSFNELLDTPIDFSNFIMNQLGTKAADYGNIKWIEDLVPRSMWIHEPINYDKHAFCGVSHWGRKRQQFYGFAVNRESALDVYSKRRIIAVTDLKIVKWHNYKHLDWISNRLNLTMPDTYRFDLKRREAYTAHSNPRGFIYQDKDKKNRLMRIDELHKFSDGTLNDVRNALDDRLKGIMMQYLPQTIWRKGDKDRAVDMIQAIDKMIKTRRIIRSLERFVGGRLYKGDFQML